MAGRGARYVVPPKMMHVLEEQGIPTGDELRELIGTLPRIAQGMVLSYMENPNLPWTQHYVNAGGTGEPKNNVGKIRCQSDVIRALAGIHAEAMQDFAPEKLILQLAHDREAALTDHEKRDYKAAVMATERQARLLGYLGDSQGTVINNIVMQQRENDDFDLARLTPDQLVVLRWLHRLAEDKQADYPYESIEALLEDAPRDVTPAIPEPIEATFSEVAS